MTLRLSSKLSNSMMDTASLKGSIAAFVIDIYGGTIPGTPKFANDVPGSTKLARISLTGTGSALSWETSSTEGQLEKNASEVWYGLCTLAGTATWFRICTVADDQTDDDTTKTRYRIDGTVGTSGADMNLASTTFALNDPIVISAFSLTLPR